MKIKDMALATALLASLTGCLAPGKFRSTVIGPYTLTEEDQDVIRRSVASLLKDPYSAQFLPSRAGVLADGKIALCGQVNARNSYGGYGGYKAFNGYLERGGDGQLKVYVLWLDDPGYRIAANNCADAGISL